MSFPDYHQKADDHLSILILVKQLVTENQLSIKSFNKIYERIKRINEVKIQDAQGMGFERIIRLRFTKNEYELENNEWGDFQAHRKVLGLISVGHASQDSEVDNIYDEHDKAVQQYASSLLDSRCFIFKGTPDTNKLEPQAENHQSESGAKSDNQGKPSLSTNHSADTNSNPSEESSAVTETSTDRKVSTISAALTDPLSADIDERAADPVVAQVKTRNVQGATYNSNTLNGSDINESSLHSIEHAMEQDIKNLVASLFWVLESKRLDRSYEKLDRINLLVAPFESKTFVGVDTDTKAFKKRGLGRMKKHIGDLSLLAGLPAEALTHYANAIVILKGVNDWLWLAAAIEGQCVASLALLYPTTGRRKMSLQRNASLPPSKFRQLQESVASSPGSNGNDTTDAKAKKKFLPSISFSPDTQNMHSRSLPNGLDPVISKALGKSLLSTPTEIYDKYKEACCHYAKLKPAAVIEMECSFKAARVLTFLEKFMGASEFIQNAVFISLTLSNEEQIRRLSVISTLYTEIGYHRKSAFYKRFAALKAVSLNLSDPNWDQCYYLLVPALEGYRLTLDPIEYDRRAQTNSRAIGWMGIHLQLLQELVTTARRMKLEQLAIRHLSFLLHSLFEYLTPAQRQEFSSQLMSLSTHCGEGAPVPLTLENGAVIPSVNLTKFPYIVSFKVQKLAPHLRPMLLKSKLDKKNASSPSSPFIFTPLQLNRPLNNRRPSVHASQLQDFKWVQNELCEVSLHVYNYLPTELSVSHIKLMTDGVAFEGYPTSLRLDPEHGPVQVSLTGTPRGCGKLDILGYSSHVLGVKSNCRLKELPNAKKMKMPVNFAVDVVAPLPLISLTCSGLHKTNTTSPLGKEISDFVAANYAVSLFAGEKKSCIISFSNSSSNNDELVELATCRVVTKLKKDAEEKLISFPCDISDNLPLAAGASFDFAVNFYGDRKFVVEKTKQKLPVPSQSASTWRSGNSSPQYAAGSSGLSSPVHGRKQTSQIGNALANFLSDLQTSSTTGVVKLKDKRVEHPLDGSSLETFPPTTIDLVLEFEYSGGPGLASGYCRKSALRFNVEISPSVLITHWDVLPAETPSRCFLVLDVFNATNMEMELKYSTNKSILIEARETCRIPVPVDRCPLRGQDGDAQQLSLLSKCKSHLMDQVNLEYTLIGSGETHGVASIGEIPWSAAMLDTILMSPLQWDVKLNDAALSTDKPEYVCGVGHRVKVTISLSNCSEHPLRSLCLWVQLYQDHQNGTRNYRLDMKRALFGCDKIFIHEVAPSDVYRHECSFLFFYTGLYKMDIQCSGFGGSSFQTLPLQDDSKDSGSYYKQQQQLRAEMMANKSGAAIAANQTSDGPFLWKCTPSVEIIVSDLIEESE